VRGAYEVDDDLKSLMTRSANSHSVLKAQLHWQPTHSHRLLAVVDLGVAVRCVAGKKAKKREKGTPTHRHFTLRY
jgi:uncharacterized iron-regulated protein